MILGGTKDEKQRYTADLLTGCSWHIHRISPLYNLPCDSSNGLQELSSRLEHHLGESIQAEKEKELGNSLENNPNNTSSDVNIIQQNEQEKIPTVTVYFKRCSLEGKNDIQYLEIQIEIVKQGDKTKSTKYKAIKRKVTKCTKCTLVLFSGSYKGLMHTKGFRNFTFILSKGKTALIKKVFSWLEVRYDCKVGQTSLTIAPRHLSKLAKKWSYQDLIQEQQRDAGSQFHSPGGKEELMMKSFADWKQHSLNSTTSQPLELTFEFPEGVVQSGLEQVKIAIPERSLLVLHKSMKDAECTEPGSQFIDAIEAYFYERTSILLNGAKLVRVATPSGVIGAEGRIKILRTKELESTLNEIANFAQLEVSLK